MKASEIRELTTEEIVARIQEDEEELGRLRLNHAISSIERPSEIQQLRRTVARLKTILHERELEQTEDNQAS